MNLFRFIEALTGQQWIAIKADIEGMEPEMLRGRLDTLKKFKPDIFLEISTNDIMAEIEGILYPLGYKKLCSHAATPVWHFSHISKLSPTRRIVLSIFRLLMKIRDFPYRVVSAIMRKFGYN